MRDERIKVLAFLTDFNIGGTERQVLNLARGLSPERFDLHMACFRRSGRLIAETEHRPIPLQEYAIHKLAHHRTFRQQMRFARDLRRNGIQIVHTYGFYANVFGLPAARMAGVPRVVASIRDTCDLLRPAQRWVQRWVCRMADYIVVNADAVRRRLIADGYEAGRIVVIRNGVALDRFQTAPRPARALSDLGIPPQAPVVAVISRLNQLKGIDYFLEAGALLVHDFPHVRFLIIGNGACRDGLERLAAELGLADRTIFSGFRLDVPEMLSGVTVSVLPSLSEGLSNTLLESMAAGVPVVATTVGGNPEIIEDGVSGLLVPPRDPVALARAISTVLRNTGLAASLGRTGRERVIQWFSQDRMVRETENLYLKILNRPMRARAVQGFA